DVGMAGDAEASLPFLIEAVRSAIPSDKKAAFEKRGEALKKAWKETRDRQRQVAAIGWEARPINTPPPNAEGFKAGKHEDGSLGTSTGNTSGWSERLFAMDRHYRWLGRSGASGLGYGLPASVGAAHANKALGRFSVSIQGDGDMMYAPGAVWTAAHHEIP